MNDNAIGIRLIKIELFSKSIAAPSGGLESYDNKNIDFNLETEIRISVEQKLAFVLTAVQITKKVEETEEASFKLLSTFEFDDFDKAFKKIDNEENDVLYKASQPLEVFLKSTGVSVLRGVMYAELRGSSLQDQVLPLIDMNEIVHRDESKGTDDIAKKSLDSGNLLSD